MMQPWAYGKNGTTPDFTVLLPYCSLQMALVPCRPNHLLSTWIMEAVWGSGCWCGEDGQQKCCLSRHSLSCNLRQSFLSSMNPFLIDEDPHSLRQLFSVCRRLVLLFLFLLHLRTNVWIQYFCHYPQMDLYVDKILIQIFVHFSSVEWTVQS